MKEIDRLTLNTNKVRAMNAQRTRAVGIGIQADMLGVSANNMFSTASSISPFMNMTSTLLTGATNIVGNLPENFFK